uniref:Uncharacterized protein n=1 Tax=Rhizophora mucronata TaxID=61149 RepID=A0A2P2QN09_RHIMU
MMNNRCPRKQSLAKPKSPQSRIIA